MSFNYQARKPEDWDKRGNQSGSNFASALKDEYDVFQPKKGDSWIRILPPTWDKPNHYGFDVWVHYQVGPNNGQVVCLSKMKNQKCPLCEAMQKAKDAGREDADDFKPTRRVLVWLLNRAAEKDKDKPLLWAMPWTLDRDISKICKDKISGELYQIDHPEAGYDVMFEREGEPPIVKYIGIQLARKPSSVEQSALDFIVKNPVQNAILWRSYEEVSALFEGQPVEAPSQASVATSAPQPSVPANAPQPAPVVFVSSWTNTVCPSCAQPQFTTPTGVSCSNAHAYTEPNVPVPVATPPPPPVQAAPPAVQPPVAAPPQAVAPPPPAGQQTVANQAAASTVAPRAASLRERFTTGAAPAEGKK